MTLHSPILEDFEGPYRNASIMCQVKNLLSQEVDIQWMKNGVLLKSGITTMSSTYDDEWYLLTSELSVTEGEWNADNNYTCLVDSPEFSEMKNISKSITCGCKSTPSSGPSSHSEMDMIHPPTPFILHKTPGPDVSALKYLPSSLVLWRKDVLQTIPLMFLKIFLGNFR